jgi:ribonuclease HI
MKLSVRALQLQACTAAKKKNLDIRPSSILKYNPATIWYTEGSKKSIEGSDLIGAGVLNDQHNVLLNIDLLGQNSTNIGTITRAELDAIPVTLQQIEDCNTDQIIATDSQACMYMIHKRYKRLYEPHKHAGLQTQRTLASYSHNTAHTSQSRQSYYLHESQVPHWDPRKRGGRPTGHGLRGNI